MIDFLCLLQTNARRARLCGNSGSAEGRLAGPVTMRARGPRSGRGGFPHFPLVRYPLASVFPERKTATTAAPASRARFVRCRRGGRGHAIGGPLFFAPFNENGHQSHYWLCLTKLLNHRRRPAVVLYARAQHSFASKGRNHTRPTRVHISPYYFNVAIPISGGSESDSTWRKIRSRRIDDIAADPQKSCYSMLF